MFPQLAHFTDLALLLMRLMVGLIFFTSGYRDAKDRVARTQGVGMSKPFTVFPGIAEIFIGFTGGGA
jgi:uncharacterized membrane protein YphA (DoxX/SURF4 family)